MKIELSELPINLVAHSSFSSTRISGEKNNLLSALALTHAGNMCASSTCVASDFRCKGNESFVAELVTTTVTANLIVFQQRKDPASFSLAHVSIFNLPAPWTFPSPARCAMDLLWCQCRRVLHVVASSCLPRTGRRLLVCQTYVPTNTERLSLVWLLFAADVANLSSQ